MSCTSAPRRTSAASRSTSGRIRRASAPGARAPRGGRRPTAGRRPARRDAARARRGTRAAPSRRRPGRSPAAPAGPAPAPAPGRARRRRRSPRRRRRRQLGPQRLDPGPVPRAARRRTPDEMCGVATSTSVPARSAARASATAPARSAGPSSRPGSTCAVQVDHAAQAMALARRGPWSRTLCPAWIALPIARPPAGAGAPAAAGAADRAVRVPLGRLLPGRDGRGGVPPAAARRRPDHARPSPVRGLEPGARRLRRRAGGCSRRGRSSRRSGPTRRCARWSSSTASSPTR